MDITQTEQLTLCATYVDVVDNLAIVRENFLQFVPIYDMTGRGIAEVILKSLENLEINVSKMVGQGYDGAAAMSGEFNGVQAAIKEKYPAAVYVHCASHSLNLALCHACDIQAIRNCVGTIKCVTKFIKSSAQHTKTLLRQTYRKKSLGR